MTAAPLYNDIARGPADARAHWLIARDGTRLRLAIWNRQAARGTVFLLPGRTEYVEKYGLAATTLAASGYMTLCIDWRGQGLSARALPDPLQGHVDDFAEYQTDLDTALMFARSEHLPEPYYMLAHSMGGNIGLRHLTRLNAFNAAAFSAPMWGIGVANWMRPFTRMIGAAAHRLALDHRYAPGTGPAIYVTDSPFAGNTLTTDPDRWEYMRQQALAQPQLSLGGPTFGWLRAALTECAALAKLPAPDLPVLTGLGTQERIVDTQPIRTRMSHWPKGRLDLYPNAEHEVMMERPQTRNAFLASAVALFNTHR